MTILPAALPAFHGRRRLRLPLTARLRCLPHAAHFPPHMNEGGRGGAWCFGSGTRCPAACLFEVATRKAEPAGGVCVAQVAHGARQMRRRRLQLLILFLLDSPAMRNMWYGGGSVARHAPNFFNASMAFAYPCAAARRYNRMASALSCATPRPFSNMRPKLN